MLRQWLEQVRLYQRNRHDERATPDLYSDERQALEAPPNTRMQHDRFAREIMAFFGVIFCGALAAAEVQAVRRLIYALLE
jgi:hypothetical protein